jgi:hypothetical protein
MVKFLGGARQIRQQLHVWHCKNTKLVVRHGMERFSASQQTSPIT